MDALESYHHVTTTAIRYFGVSGVQRKTFARTLPSASLDGNCPLFWADFGWFVCGKLAALGKI